MRSYDYETLFALELSLVIMLRFSVVCWSGFDRDLRRLMDINDRIKRPGVGINKIIQDAIPRNTPGFGMIWYASRSLGSSAST